MELNRVENGELNKGGRPPNTLLDFMRIKAWLAFIMTKLNVKTYEEIQENILGPIPKGMSPIKYFDLDNFAQDIRWDRYLTLQHGPNKTYLSLIEQFPKAAGSSSVYKVGPYDGQENIPLWIVFEHDLDAIWNYLFEHLPEIKNLSQKGAPFFKKLELVVELFVPNNEWAKLNFKINKPNSKNIIVVSYQKRYFQPSFELLTIAMAIYRVALHTGESMAQVEYLIRGLLSEPYAELLEKYNIYSEFVAAFNQLEINDLIQRGEIKLAQNLLSKMTGAKV